MMAFTVVRWNSKILKCLFATRVVFFFLFCSQNLLDWVVAFRDFFYSNWTGFVKNL